MEMSGQSGEFLVCIYQWFAGFSCSPVLTKGSQEDTDRNLCFVVSLNFELYLLLVPGLGDDDI